MHNSQKARWANLQALIQGIAELLASWFPSLPVARWLHKDNKLGDMLWHFQHRFLRNGYTRHKFPNIPKEIDNDRIWHTILFLQVRVVHLLRNVHSNPKLEHNYRDFLPGRFMLLFAARSPGWICFHDRLPPFWGRTHSSIAHSFDKVKWYFPLFAKDSQWYPVYFSVSLFEEEAFSLRRRIKHSQR